ncbi:ArsR/SmtB family transcription factor [Kutzneria sp. NPDC052558]|uniref:ArsR/SmtB family transcription factor n=1 Tax=Kutzneria sp. NPDC052558 TaxID=3364121 RepID=UPI0037C7B5F0
MLRFHFTAEDLLSTRVAAGPAAAWELLLSLHLLQSKAGGAVFRSWRAAAVRTLTDAMWLRELFTLTPARGYSPDFLTPTGDLDEALDMIVRTPAERLRTELSGLAGKRTVPKLVAELLANDRKRLVDLLREYHRVALKPVWPQVLAAVDTDRAMRGRAMLAGGMDALLGGLPDCDWENRVLTVDYPVSRDVHLNGRGLLLTPSAFCWRRPITLADPKLPPVLVYPVEHGDEWTGAAPTRPLSDLIGRTRATVLTIVGDGCTTGELACRAVISAASASEHVAVLRGAGLLSTRRLGRSAVHRLTPLGRSLLHRGDLDLSAVPETTGGRR